MAYSVPDPYSAAVRNGLALTYTVDATLGGAPVRLEMQPTGGTITDTTKPGVRRQLNLELAAEPGLYDLLSAPGVMLTVTCHVAYTNQTGVDIPMGVFSVDQSSVSVGGGKLTLTAPDKWVKIQRSNFTGPTASTVGGLVTGQIASLVRGALGASESVVVSSTSQATVGALTWDPASTSRAQAIIDLATGAGVWVYFDRTGVCHIDDVQQVQPTADWLIDAGTSGVLLSLDRQADQTHSYNVVVVSSSASSGAAFPDQVVWDSDSSSATYAGTDPINHPELAGPFGVRVYHWSTPLPLDAAGAKTAGLSILARTVGIASTASLGSVPISAMDSFDSLDVLPPRQATYVPLVSYRHIADTVTHSLDVQQPMTVQTRSTRTDAYT